MAVEAEFASECGRCGHGIRRGDMIVRDELAGGWDHEACPTSSRLDLQPGEVVCTECFVVKPCPCEDGL